MNEGKGLLLKIVENKLSSIESLTENDVIVKGINLVELYNELEENIDNFAELTDDIIEEFTEKTNKKKSFQTSVFQLRDLLIGKRDYNLKVNLTDKHKEVYVTFKNKIKDYIEAEAPGLIDVDEIASKCQLMIQQITRKEIVTNLDFIEEIVEDYNAIEKDNNMVKIMKFVNEHNLNILRTPRKNGPLLNIDFIFKPRINEKLQEILKKFDIDRKELPNYLLSELKKCNADEVYETYQMIRKNKAEDYGILHLVKKHNTLAKIILTLYSTPESVKNVVDSLRNKEGIIDIPLLRIVINNILPAFLIKKNEYFIPMYEDYMKNINRIKELGVNYKALINRTPLLLVMKNDALELTLKTCKDNGADEKAIVNKLYKTLAVEPSLIIENIEVLNNYSINMKEYFDKGNYNLLKVSDLNKKIKYLEKYNGLDTNNLDTELLNKMLVGKVYRECLNPTNKEIWGDLK